MRKLWALGLDECKRSKLEPKDTLKGMCGINANVARQAINELVTAGELENRDEYYLDPPVA